TLLALRDRGLPLPAGGVCLSPWADLTNSGASMQRNADTDPLVKKELVDNLAQTYLQGQDPRAPLASPLFADLHGLPPLLIQVGTIETLLDDAARLAERARAAGVASRGRAARTCGSGSSPSCPRRSRPSRTSASSSRSAPAPCRCERAAKHGRGR
ncbi:MAG: hypothetical protein C4290_11840, partial [Chloroflexota bacterium]